MKNTIKTTYTDQEFRQLIREELKAVLTGESEQIAGGGDDGFINLKQAAEFLKLSEGTMYQLVHKKALSVHRSGRKLLFKKSDLVRYIGDKTSSSEGEK